MADKEVKLDNKHRKYSLHHSPDGKAYLLINAARNPSRPDPSDSITIEKGQLVNITGTGTTDTTITIPKSLQKDKESDLPKFHVAAGVKAKLIDETGKNLVSGFTRSGAKGPAFGQDGEQNSLQKEVAAAMQGVFQIEQNVAQQLNTQLANEQRALQNQQNQAMGPGVMPRRPAGKLGGQRGNPQGNLGQQIMKNQRAQNQVNVAERNVGLLSNFGNALDQVLNTADAISQDGKITTPEMQNFDAAIAQAKALIPRQTNVNPNNTQHGRTLDQVSRAVHAAQAHADGEQAPARPGGAMPRQSVQRPPAGGSLNALREVADEMVKAIDTISTVAHDPKDVDGSGWRGFVKGDARIMDGTRTTIKRNEKDELKELHDTFAEQLQTISKLAKTTRDPNKNAPGENVPALNDAINDAKSTAKQIKEFKKSIDGHMIETGPIDRQGADNIIKRLNTLQNKVNQAATGKSASVSGDKDFMAAAQEAVAGIELRLTHVEGERGGPSTARGPISNITQIG